MAWVRDFAELAVVGLRAGEDWLGTRGCWVLIAIVVAVAFVAVAFVVAGILVVGACIVAVGVCPGWAPG